MAKNFWLKGLWDLLTENWGLKFVSLLLAIGFWFYAAGKEIVEVTRTIPLKFELDKRELSIATSSVHAISVRLRAPRALLSVVSAGDVAAFHRISGITQAGDYSFRVIPSDFKLPSDNIRVVGIYPEIVNVKIDETIVKKLSVQPQFVGDPAYGYKIIKDKVEINPNAILVEGSKAKLNGMDSIKTESIELVGRTQTFRKLVRIVLDSDLRPASDTIIDVMVPIREEFTDQKFTDVMVKPLGVPAKHFYVDVETEKVSFELKGPMAELEKLSRGEVFVYVEVTGLDKGAHEIPARFVLPDSVSLKGNPPNIKLDIKKIPQS